MSNGVEDGPRGAGLGPLDSGLTPLKDERAAQLEALIVRLEAAVGPDRELDADIDVTVRPGEIRWKQAIGTMEMYPTVKRASSNYVGGFVLEYVPAYTASIDAALTLVPEGWRLYGLSDQTHFQSNCGWHAGVDQYFGRVCMPHNIHSVQAPTAPLAICIASLRARLAEHTAPTGREAPSPQPASTTEVKI